MASTSAATSEKIKAKLDMAKPSMYSVIYMNDNVTTMEFVIGSLMAIFHHSAEAAGELCRQIHEDGSAVVAVLPYELAEQKGVEATVAARNAGFPLMVKLEATV